MRSAPGKNRTVNAAESPRRIDTGRKSTTWKNWVLLSVTLVMRISLFSARTTMVVSLALPGATSPNTTSVGAASMACTDCGGVA